MPADQTRTSPAVGATEITHASIVEVLVQARGAIQRTITAWGCGNTKLVEDNKRLIDKIDQLLDGLTRPNPDANGCFWWLFAIGVPSDLVADGRVFDAEQLEALRDAAVGTSALVTHGRLERLRENTIVKLIGCPDAAAIEKVQDK